MASRHWKGDVRGMASRRWKGDVLTEDCFEILDRLTGPAMGKQKLLKVLIFEEIILQNTKMCFTPSIYLCAVMSV